MSDTSFMSQTYANSGNMQSSVVLPVQIGGPFDSS